ncbi:serine hydrolase [Streptomyces sp. MBT58]|nr:serine hydrolase [Streptomyces sp. MBT58]
MPSMIRTSIRPAVDFPAPCGPVRNGAGTGTDGPRQPTSQARARASVSALAKFVSRNSRSMPFSSVSRAGMGSSPVSWVRRQHTSRGSGTRTSHPLGWMRTDCPSSRPRSSHVAPSNPGATRMWVGWTSWLSASASIKSNASLSEVPLKTPTPSLKRSTMSSCRWLPVVP